MAAPVEVYVDLDLDSDTGDGEIGTPYGRLQHALDTETQATNGNRFNCKGSFTLTADFNLTTYTVPTVTQPLIIQGYTTAAGDGGKAIFDLNDLYAFWDVTTYNFIHLIDLEVFDGLTVDPVRMQNDCSVINCHIHDIPNNRWSINLAQRGFAANNFINDTGLGIIGQSGTLMRNNRVLDVAQAGLSANGGGVHIMHNIVRCNGGADGIRYDDGSCIENNSIFSTGGNAHGIDANATGTPFSIRNNLVEGFSNTGGIGIEIQANYPVAYYDGNAVFNCDTDYQAPEMLFRGDTSNESLSVSPFVDAAGGDFRPVNTGSVKEGSLPGGIGNF